ncbi:unnamed protein product, partial [Rotaria sp. Silwood1]
MNNEFGRYIKIGTLLGMNPKTIHVELATALGPNAPSYPTIARWAKCFREGREDLNDDPPVSELTAESIELVRQVSGADTMMMEVTVALFYTVTTVSGHQISVTPDHYIRVENNGYDIASQLTLNHSLFVAQLNHPVRIRSIKQEFKAGLFSPVTFAGTILVNDVFASCYCLNNLRGTHYEKHHLYAPFRLWYYVAKYYLGFGSEVYHMPRDSIHWVI